jgi:hypothetical protein
VLVVLISKEIDRSQYVRREVTYANDLARAIIPVRLEKEVQLTGALDFYLRPLQWVPAYEVPASQWQEQLYVRIMRLLSGEEEDEASPGQQQPEYANYTDALKAAAPWTLWAPLLWWLVCGVLPTAAIMLEHGKEGVFLAKLWPHFFLFPLLIGFFIPLCLVAPMRYLVRTKRLGPMWLAGLAVASAPLEGPPGPKWRCRARRVSGWSVEPSSCARRTRSSRVAPS